MNQTWQLYQNFTFSNKSDLFPKTDQYYIYLYM